MQISNIKEIKLSFILSIVSVIGVWFSQNSINAYWQQNYHQDSPLTVLDSYQLWKLGGVLQTQSTQFYAKQLEALENQFQSKLVSHSTTELTENTELSLTDIQPELPVNHISEAENKNSDIYVSQNTENNVTENTKNNVPESAVQNSTEIHPETPLTKTPTQQYTQPVIEADVMEIQAERSRLSQNLSQVVLQPGDNVLFGGDSLMQGVAPKVRQWLKSKYQITSIDLSKQSTGLSYPSFFDWPKTVETQLKTNKKIKLVVMFLGPNDPWDIPDPNKKGGKYLKFKSPEWEAIYQSRIQRILDVANQHNVSVIWLGIPYMKKAKLNEQVAYLDQVIEKTIGKQAIFLPTKQLLSHQETQYSEGVMLNGKMVKMRSKDGIHFTNEGQKRLAEYIQQYIVLQE